MFLLIKIHGVYIRDTANWLYDNNRSDDEAILVSEGRIRSVRPLKSSDMPRVAENSFIVNLSYIELVESLKENDA